MKKFVLQILLIILVATNISFAQNTLLAGKIVDGNNLPVAGAVIKAVIGKKVIEATTDKDGLYYTKLLPAGKYRMSVYTGGQTYKASDINVPAADNTKRFHNFQLAGSKAMMHIDEQDPFMAAAFEKIEADKHFIDMPEKNRRNMRLKYDDLIIDANGMWYIKNITDSLGRDIKK